MQQIGQKGVQILARPGWRANPLGIVQDIKIWLCYQMLYVQTRIRLRFKKKRIKFSGYFEIQTDHLISCQMMRPSDD